MPFFSMSGSGFVQMFVGMGDKYDMMALETVSNAYLLEKETITGDELMAYIQADQKKLESSAQESEEAKPEE